MDADDRIGEASILLCGFACPGDTAIIRAIKSIARRSPFRHMSTRGGYSMSAAMTNCGDCGWVSDARGYRYETIDPLTGKPWPDMPGMLARLGHRAAAAAGFSDFHPDACLVNRYVPGSRMSLHQDRDEADFDQPIVSVSLGIPATFLWGGLKRRDRPEKITLVHGDVVVWGGPDRLRYHGIATVRDDRHPLTDHARINLTFRKAH